MRNELIAVSIALLAVVSIGPAQTTQPASDGRLDYRASRAFDRGDYATALPLLRKLSDELKDKPAKLAVVTERIRVCEQALPPAKTDPATQPALSRRQPHAPPIPGQTLAMTIKELGNFEYDPDKGGGIPDDVTRLSGSKIRLRGFMMPMDQAEHVTRFALVPSLFSCCFGQPPQVQHTIVVECAKGQEVAFSPDEVVVEGKLKVQETKDDGYVVSIFELVPSSVQVAATK